MKSGTNFVELFDGLTEEQARKLAAQLRGLWLAEKQRTRHAVPCKLTKVDAGTKKLNGERPRRHYGN
jgi:hypothetical protein